MSKCPRCFTPLTPDLFAWVCVSNDCAAAPDQIASQFSGVLVQSRPIVKMSRPSDAKKWSPPDVMPCQHCGNPSRPICPECHYELPADWRRGNSICIALAGARATGKSVYVGVLVKQLEQMLHQMDMSLSFATEDSRELYETHYERPLYEARGILRPTAAANVQDSYQRDPLILSLGMIRGARQFLVIRDVAGEDLEGTVSDVGHLSYFARADAVFFMFDPSAVPEVRDLLKDLLPPQLHEVGNPVGVLENLMRLIESSSPPIAMIVSKFDTMQALRDVKGTEWSTIMSNPGAAFQRDPGMFRASHDPADAELLHYEARSLLTRLGAQQFVATMARPHHGRPYRHRFFAVSALGEAAEGDKINRRGIASFRCLDPVRWVLADQGLI